MSQDAPRRRIYPQRLQYAFVEVDGEPEAEFTPFPLRLAAGMVGGLLLVVLGLGLMLFGLSDDWELIFVGLLLGGVGVVLGWAMWRVWGEKIFVCPGGLVRQRGRKVECCCWTHIKQIVQKKGKASYRLVPRKGDVWTLDANHTPQIRKLIEHIRQRTEKHSIPWKVESESSE